MNLYCLFKISGPDDDSLEELDPNDVLFDGGSRKLYENDAIIIPFEGTAYFYKVRWSARPPQNYPEIIWSSKNENVFYEKVSESKNTFEGAIPGETIIAWNGPIIPPNSFSGGTQPYQDLAFQKWNIPLQNEIDNWCYYATAIYGDYLHVLTGTDRIKINLKNGMQTTYSDLSGYYSYYNIPGHCLEDSSAEKYVTDLEYSDTLTRYNLDLEAEEPIAYTFDPGITWTTIFGADTPCPGQGIRFGRWHYTYGGWNSNNIGHARIDVTTGKVEQLENIPSPGLTKGMACPDFANDAIWHASFAQGSPLLRYNITTNDWTTFANTPIKTQDNMLCWKSDRFQQIILIGEGSLIAIFDLVLESWEVAQARIDQDHALYNGSFVLFYKEVGAIWPWAYFFVENEEERFGHSIIPETNPLIMQIP